MLTREFLMSGHAMLTVNPSPAFIAARAQLGEEYHDEYGYLVERVHLNGPHWPAQYFVKAKVRSKRGNVTYAYLGEMDAKTGMIRMTSRSSFPETATRVKVARSIFKRIWEGQLSVVLDAGWQVSDANALVAVA